MRIALRIIIGVAAHPSATFIHQASRSCSCSRKAPPAAARLPHAATLKVRRAAAALRWPERSGPSVCAAAGLRQVMGGYDMDRVGSLADWAAASGERSFPGFAEVKG